MDRTATLAETLALAATGGAPEWVHLLPAGTVRGADGRGPYTIDAAALVVDLERPLPIDRDHALDLAAKDGRPAPAAGWITALEAREDGLWGRVEWTGEGGRQVAAREYRFLSPVFLHGKDSRVTRLLRAALTNIPNLDLVALAAAEVVTRPAEGDPMDELRKVAEALGLGDGADAAAVLAAVEAIKIEKDEAVALAAKQAEPDPARFVPVTALQAVQAELSQIRAGIAEEKATAAVVGAIEAGKLAPALKDWGLALARKDLAAFTAFAIDAPSIHGQVVPAAKPAGGTAIDDTERAICAQLGLTPEAYLQARNEEAR